MCAGEGGSRLRSPYLLPHVLGSRSSDAKGRNVGGIRDGSIKCALIFYGSAAATRSPPIFAAKAGLDTEEINEAIDVLQRRAQEIGADVQVVTREQGVHGFDLRNHDARSREIVREAVAFVRDRI